VMVSLMLRALLLGSGLLVALAAGGLLRLP
jgi:hypothetical protein